MTKTLEDRVSELEARHQITEVIANYNHGIDKRDVELFMDVWEENALWDLGDPEGCCRNKQEILERLKISWRDVPKTHHYTVNIVINPDIKNGVATAISDLDATATNKEGIPLVIAGTYYDTFSNSTGKWRLTERKLRIHSFTPVSELASAKSSTRNSG
ncbi:nuclear transport factor 2 family protein [Alkalihalobacillus sp. MEB130]|uniref:nuclear transport factor 2 family protein n=1 Tax=Alkalihalobacillus sp. MEB130 TaxID=2976704 RepID=UPI0028DFF826|nr:nuclear transport factor 2 family protein [Alkalihalobacillus sp. MEB130]MDT8860259.1 nuclear transport factor 2 family protein [Alkalihalobacillus sp. MEB130]